MTRKDREKQNLLNSTQGLWPTDGRKCGKDVSKEVVNKDVPTKPSRQVKAYVFFTGVSDKELRKGPQHFFDTRSKDLPECTLPSPVFFDKNRAIQYSPFLNRDHVIVEVDVPAKAVEALTGHLAIRRDALSQSGIQSCCFPNSQEPFQWNQNPAAIGLSPA